MSITSKASELILVVEDSNEDYEALLRASSKAGIHSSLHRCEDGEEALRYLFRALKSPTRECRMPALILLDLNMPGLDGLEVLKALKENSDFRKIPVVILSSSSEPRDVDRCYDNGSCSYMLKPANVESYVEALLRLEKYWFDTVIIPRDES